MSHFDDTNDTVIRRSRQPSQPMGAPGSHRAARAIAAVNVDTSQAEEARVAEADGDMLPVLYRPSERRQVLPAEDNAPAAVEAVDEELAEQAPAGVEAIGQYPAGVPDDGIMVFSPQAADQVFASSNGPLPGPQTAVVSGVTATEHLGPERPHSAEPTMVALASVATLRGDDAFTFLSVKTEGSKELDGFLAPLADLADDEEVVIDAIVRFDPSFAGGVKKRIGSIRAGNGDPNGPQNRGWRKARQLVTKSQSGSSGPRKPTDDEKDLISQLQRKLGSSDAPLKHFEVDLHIAVFKRANRMDRLNEVLRGVQEKFDMFESEHQGLVWKRCDPRLVTSGVMPFKRSADAPTFSSTELASMFRLPDDDNRPQKVSINRATQIALVPDYYEAIEAPYTPLDPPKGLIPLGVLNQGTEDETFVGWSTSCADTHFVTFGGTGTGKSVQTTWEVVGAAKNNEPVIVICPHAELADDLLRDLPIYCPERKKDILYLDLGDPEYSPAMNPLDVRSPQEVEAAVGRVMSIMGSHFTFTAQSHPRAHKIAPLILLALAEANLKLPEGHKATLLNVSDFLQDIQFQQLVMACLSKDRFDVRRAFDPENGTWHQQNEQKQEEAAAPLMRNFDAAGNSRQFGNVLASPDDKLDYARIVKDNSILIVSLGRFGDQAGLGEFLGGLILPTLFSTIGSYGRKRDPRTGTEIPGGVRLIVDEAPVLLRDSSELQSAFAEWRKYDGKVSLKAQNPEQFDPSVRSAIWGNVMSLMSLRVGRKAVAGLPEAISTTRTEISAADISSLANYESYARMMQRLPDGTKQQSEPFALGMLLPLAMMEERLNGPISEAEKERRLKQYDIDLAEIRARSRKRLYNLSTDMDRRREIAEDTGSSIPRRRMTQDMVDELTTIAAHRAVAHQAAREHFPDQPSWLDGVGDDLIDEAASAAELGWEADDVSEDQRGQP